MNDDNQKLEAALAEITSLRALLAAVVKAHGAPLSFDPAELHKASARVRLSVTKDEPRGRLLLNATL